MKILKSAKFRLKVVWLLGLILLLLWPGSLGAQSKTETKKDSSAPASQKLKPPGPPPSGPTDKPVVKPKGIRGSHILFIPLESSGNAQGDGKNIPHLKGASLAEYTEIGIIEVLGVGDNLALESLLPEFKKQAGKMGASAFYKLQLNRFTTYGEALYGMAIALRRRQ